MARNNKELNIYTFLAFEKQAAEDIFYKNSILSRCVKFHIFDKQTFKRDNSLKIFLGICAGNPSQTQKGEIYACKSVTSLSSNAIIEVFPEIDLKIEKCDFLCTKTAIDVSFKWPNNIKVADMETVDVVEANTQRSNIFRIVCDHGINTNSFSLKDYKNEVLKHYLKGLRILKDKILYLTV